jgi:hypothetical protein
MSRIITTALLSTGLAVVAVAPASAAQQERSGGEPAGRDRGLREVCVKSAYVDHKPGSVVIGTLFKHEQINVARYSPSGRFAYGFAHGHVQKRGWVKTAQLCK